MLLSLSREPLIRSQWLHGGQNFTSETQSIGKCGKSAARAIGGSTISKRLHMTMFLDGTSILIFVRSTDLQTSLPQLPTATSTTTPFPRNNSPVIASIRHTTPQTAKPADSPSDSLPSSCSPVASECIPFDTHVSQPVCCRYRLKHPKSLTLKDL